MTCVTLVTVYRPKAPPDMPLAGSGLTEHLVDAHERIRGKYFTELSDKVHRLCVYMPDGLKIGTTCSGSDTPILIMNKLMNFWRDTLGWELGISHEFSCDNNAHCQRFVSTHFSPKAIFDDVRALHREVGHDIVSNTDLKIPDVDWFIFGAECDNYSKLNNFTRATACVESGEGRSGETIQGCLSYVELRRPMATSCDRVCSCSHPSMLCTHFLVS